MPNARTSKKPRLSPREEQALAVAVQRGFLEEYGWSHQTNQAFETYCRDNAIPHIRVRTYIANASITVVMPEGAAFDSDAQRAVIELGDFNRRGRPRPLVTVSNKTATLARVHLDTSHTIAGKLVRIATNCLPSEATP